MTHYDDSSALFVIDIQNDFADPKGSLYVSAGETIVARVNAEIERAVTAGALVAYKQDWHPESTAHFKKDGGIWPVHCVQNSWGAELHPGVTQVDGYFHKGGARKDTDGYSMFADRTIPNGEEYDSGFADRLRELGVEKAVLVGLATDYCVRATALDAVRAGLGATLLSDCVEAVDLEAGDGDRAIEEMRSGGVNISTSGEGDAA